MVSPEELASTPRRHTVEKFGMKRSQSHGEALYHATATHDRRLATRPDMAASLFSLTTASKRSSHQMMVRQQQQETVRTAQREKEREEESSNHQKASMKQALVHDHTHMKKFSGEMVIFSLSANV